MTRRVNSPANPSSASFRSNSAFSYTGFGIWRGSVRKPVAVQYLDPLIGDG